MKPLQALRSLLFLLLSSAGALAQFNVEEFQQELDSIYQANPKSVGIMVHIESASRGITWSASSGYNNKEEKSRLEADQPVLIASNIKTYISAAILRMVELDIVSIDQSIDELLSPQTQEMFSFDGYELHKITLIHLLSHTSGIWNYANQDYVDFMDANKGYRWTREEQLNLTVVKGDPLGPPGATFHYADVNYLLLAEIIENQIGVPYYDALKELLKYHEIGLERTWFPTLEPKPADAKDLAYQYWGAQGWNTYEIDISWDLYGGGGIACPLKELALFSYNLFNHKIVESPEVLGLIYTEVKTQDSTASNYYLGLSKDEFNGRVAYGHGGFWGTMVMYFPDLDTSISVCILDRDQRSLRRDIINLALKYVKG